MGRVEGLFIQDKYEIVSKVKQGGFGIVYYGFDHVFEKPVAIKAVEPSLLQEAKYIDLFLEEAKNAAKLSHNNIVRIYDLVRNDDGQFFIVMEFIEGLDLGKTISLCRQRNILMPQDLVIYIIKESCKALEYAHNKRDIISNKLLKLVHRDISPSNIMVSLAGQVKLIDFGLTKIRQDENNSGQITLSGKLPYMTPEQMGTGTVDRRTDIFSLGIVFYELLVGRRLFPNDSSEKTIEIIRKAKVDTSILTECNVPDKVQQILLKMLQKNQDDRYHGANGIYIDLVEYLMSNSSSVELSNDLSIFLNDLVETNSTPACEPVIESVSEQQENVAEPSKDEPESDEIDQLSAELEALMGGAQLTDSIDSSNEAMNNNDSDFEDNTSIEPGNGSNINEDETAAQIMAKGEKDIPSDENQILEPSSDDVFGSGTTDIFKKEEISDSLEHEFNIAESKLFDGNSLADKEPVEVIEQVDSTSNNFNRIDDNTSNLNFKDENFDQRRSLREELKFSAISNTQPQQAPHNLFEEEEGDDDLKTVIDVIRLSTRTHKKKIQIAVFSFIALLIGFLCVDIFFQMTAFGDGVYNRLFPPAIKITSVPPGATITLDDKRIPGKTPLAIPKITPGVHVLVLSYAGYSPLVKSIQVPGKGEVKIPGEKTRRGYDPYIFRFKTKIDVNSDPQGASVFLNFKEHPQKTPITIDWEVGVPLSLEIEKEGFQRLSGFTLNTLDGIDDIEDNRIWDFSQVEEGDKRYQVTGKFRKFITVASIPSAVTFYVDGSSTPSGRTDVSNSLALSMGKHTILFKKNGFNSRRLTVNVDKNSAESFSIILTRKVRFLAKDRNDPENNEIGASIVKIIQNRKNYIRNETTPCELNLPPVRLKAVLKKEGYKDVIVNISPNDRDIVINMEPATLNVEIFVADALTGLPLKDVQISYRSLLDDQAAEVFYGTTNSGGQCDSKLSEGEYSFKVKKFGYFDKYAILNTKEGERMLQFKLIIQ